MSLTAHMKYQQEIFHHLHFTAYPLEYGTLWSDTMHPEYGSCLVCERPGLYALTIADYTVPASFSVNFAVRHPYLRFGSFREGKTRYEIPGFRTSASLPSDYIVKESNISGQQSWSKGEHYKGVEIALSFSYLEKLKVIDNSILALKALPDNVTQTALPAKVVTLLQELATLARSQQLTALDFSGLLMQCLASLRSSLDKGYSHNVPYAPTVFLGKRKISFTPMDYQAISAAKQIITDHPEKDITIQALSKKVFLNEQKLKVGFSLCYGTPIGAYLKDCRMTKASELLIHTNQSVEEIAYATGYSSSAGFIKAFRQKYLVTPLKFRADAQLRNLTGETISPAVARTK